ncbi:MAG: hypothetical protein JWN76_3393 [Chitinophagaceae bacterium]|nr:hypothetical protein [Chitinophagaceae bacterium]
MKSIFAMLILLFITLAAFINAAKYDLHGNVKDESGNTIAGASITIKGNNKGTTTDREGNFILKEIEGNETIDITAVGYEPKEIKIHNEKFIHVVLKSVSMQLDEVFVTGYGLARKKEISGSVAGLEYRIAKTPTRIMQADHFPVRGIYNQYNREGYDNIDENAFLKTNDNPLSTFSIDVDAASYTNIRRFLNQGQLPPAGAVRIEEMINYFTYSYPQPKDNKPFTVNTEITACPWNAQHQLVLIGLQGKRIDYDKLPPSNLVFLIDVSGSMLTADKLPLVQASLKLLVDQLRDEDKVSLVVYAGNAGLVLPPTSGDDKIKIKEAIDGLQAGGSTAGGAGIQLAYKTAAENFKTGGNNRVILCTDGDFNVGVSSDDELIRLVEEKRESGIFLTVLGYGTGNYQDAKMQKLADKGNGNHHYIDNLGEARKVLVNEFGGTLFTIAKDVKLQVEFNPMKVRGYRLIGYENRMLAKEDFNDDKKDAGELGSGHTVTALYEIIPAGVNAAELRSTDSLRYKKDMARVPVEFKDEIMQVKLRYKKPSSDHSELLEKPVQFTNNKMSDNLRFAAAVSEFGMLLRDSKFKGNANFAEVKTLASGALNNDEQGYRREFLRLVSIAASLKGKGDMAVKE